MRTCPRRRAAPRFGFTVTRQIGKAVERNRIRRRLKAAVKGVQADHARARLRLCPDRAPSGADVGVRCARDASSPRRLDRVHRAPRRGCGEPERGCSTPNRKRSNAHAETRTTRRTSFSPSCCRWPCCSPGRCFYAGPKLKDEQERRAAHPAGADARPRSSRAAPKTGPVTAPGAAPAAGRRCRPSAAPAAPAHARGRAADKPARVRIEHPEPARLDRPCRAAASTIWCWSNTSETVDPKAPTSCCSRPPARRSPTTRNTAGWRAPASTQPMPGRDTVWRVEKEAALTPASPVTLVWDNGQGLVFRRTHRRRCRLPVHGDRRRSRTRPAPRSPCIPTH